MIELCWDRTGLFIHWRHLTHHAARYTSDMMCISFSSQLFLGRRLKYLSKRQVKKASSGGETGLTKVARPGRLLGRNRQVNTFTCYLLVGVLEAQYSFRNMHNGRAICILQIFLDIYISSKPFIFIRKESIASTSSIAVQHYGFFLLITDNNNRQKPTYWACQVKHTSSQYGFPQ